MGQGASKPGDSTKHVFTSDTPIQFSQELIDSLQASSETNSSRAKTLDLHIAQRVHEELEKIQKAETSRLDELRKKLSSSDDSSSSSSSTSPSSSSSSSSSSRILDLPNLSPKDLFPKSQSTKEEDARKSQSSAKVQGEIEKLKKALGERKVLKDIPGEVDKARGEVIACLRLNDRTPLDCWREVEVFKREVRRMEERYVGSLL